MGFQNLQQHDSESDSDDEPIGPAEAAAQLERISFLREQNRLLRIERQNHDRELEQVRAERARLALETDSLFKKLQERRNRRK